MKAMPVVRNDTAPTPAASNAVLLTAIAKALRNACSESQYLVQLNNSAFRKKNPGDDSGEIMHISVKDAESPDASTS